MTNTGNPGNQSGPFRDPNEPQWQAGQGQTDPPTQNMQPIQQPYSPDADFAAPAGAAAGYGQPQNYGPPPQQTPPPQQPQQQPPKKSGGKTAAIIAGVIVLCLCVVGAAMVLARVLSGGGGDDTPTQAVGSSSEEESVVETVVETVTEEESTPAETSSSSSSSTSSSESSSPSTATEPRDHFRPNGTYAGSTNTFEYYTGSSVTTKPFAKAVAKEMVSHANATDVFTIRATSPVTNKEYEMKCVPQKADGFTCSGGDNAVVHLVRK
ncbi:hypothetical protein [Corynebacterium sp. TAE3-ERU2]|uniref:hypothetical protein n=1 Tax=Corynebacterium sp. TAE3-ERU2 TaxID=2849497 RepID=UPI001C45BE07|nr:hypothetical protein [Corynebacterium sp. TAE3-ERU2]MBV7302118.1 hypothetical protein [Corynebacterium sp. TAE3-ERU2]